MCLCENLNEHQGWGQCVRYSETGKAGDLSIFFVVVVFSFMN